MLIISNRISALQKKKGVITKKMYGKPIGFGSLSSYATAIEYLPVHSHMCLALICMLCAIRRYVHMLPCTCNMLHNYYRIFQVACELKI